MIALSLAELASILAGRLVNAPDAAALVTGEVHTDSRLIAAGDVFFALPGESTDGHLFAPAAAAAGAHLLIVERELEIDLPQVVVEAGVRALADLARAVVARVRSRGELKVVAITGSNGKTTTKNMLRAILEREGPSHPQCGRSGRLLGRGVHARGHSRRGIRCAS